MFSIYFKTHMIMLFTRYKADFLRFPPENPANYVLMYELTPLHMRGLVDQSTKPMDPPLMRTNLSINKGSN
jgi:hypothetical protein